MAHNNVILQIYYTCGKPRHNHIIFAFGAYFKEWGKSENCRVVIQGYGGVIIPVPWSSLYTGRILGL